MGDESEEFTAVSKTNARSMKHSALADYVNYFCHFRCSTMPSLTLRAELPVDFTQ